MTAKVILPALAGLTLLMAGTVAAGNIQSDIAEWRKEREAALRKDGGWLTLTGLFWLHEGANTFGRDARNEIVLADGAAHAGTFELHGGTVTLKMDGLKMDGAGREIKHDSADAAKVGRLSLFVIKRGEKYGIRLKDPESEYRRDFKGIESFPAQEEYRVTAQWVAAPLQLPILNMLGQTEGVPSPGYAVFRLKGKEYHLRPYLEEPDAKELFYVFRDLTSGKETYGAGRFFYSEMPRDGHVVLDFNKAYNPPCAFTPYATCPLPPTENRLALRIEAGEKKYGHETH
jgi:uncharacterized protein (DUF1684 family)